jgi:hypothetical protein
MARSRVLGSKLRTDIHHESRAEGASQDRRSAGSRPLEGERSELADAMLADAMLADGLADAIAVDGLDGLEANLSSPIGQSVGQSVGQPIGQSETEDQTVIQSGRIALGERP